MATAPRVHINAEAYELRNIRDNLVQIKAWLDHWRTDADHRLPVTQSSLDSADYYVKISLGALSRIEAGQSPKDEALEACEAYFDNRSDVSDGDYGIPEPNEEMRLLDTVRAALATHQTKEAVNV